MSTKDEYRRRILIAYSLLVDFEGEPVKKNVPGPLDRPETFKQWKQRVLGDEISNVRVFVPDLPDPRKSILGLQRDADASNFRMLLREIVRKEKKKSNDEIAQTKRKLISYPKESLESLLEELGDHLEPPVRESLSKFLKSTDEDMDIEEILRTLLLRYSHAVSEFKRLDRDKE